MENKWRSSIWGVEISLEYGKSLKGYRESNGNIQVFGSNGAVGWTDKALSDGPGVILGRKGAYRGVRYSKEPFFVIDTAYYVKPKTELDMQWLYYSIIHHKLGKIDDGSPIPSTTRSAVYVTDVDIPPLPEQKAIAHILGSLDDKIELNRRMNATLEGMAQALFKSWFIDFDPVLDNILVKNMANGASLEPSPNLSQQERDFAKEHNALGFNSLGSSSSPHGRSGDEGSIFDGIPDEFAERAEVRRTILAQNQNDECSVLNDELRRPKIQNSEFITHNSPMAFFPAAFQQTEAMGWIPEGWELSTVGEECDTVGGGTPSTKNPDFWEDGEYPWVTPKDFSSLQDKVLLTSSRFLTREGLNKVSSGLLPIGTVLMSSRAPVGYLAITQIETAINQGFIAMICNRRLPPEYILQWANSRMDDIKQASSGSTFAEISKKGFRPFRVIVPSGNLIESYTKTIAPIYARITDNVAESETLSSLRDTLLPKLISGELRLDA